MINTEFEIDYSDWFDEGGCCQVYPIKNHTNLVFKEFRNKKKASEITDAPAQATQKREY